MKLDRALNLAIGVETDIGVVYVHSTPISKAIFDAHWRLISKTWALIMQEGLNVVSGPRIAYLALKDVAQGMDVWESVKQTLIAEIARLTNVVYPSDSGYQTLPLDMARQRKIIDDDVFDDVLGQLVFFTLVSTMLHRQGRILAMMGPAGELWGSEITASAFTDYLNSLPILTTEQPVSTALSSPVPS